MNSSSALTAWGLPSDLIPSSTNASKISLLFDENSTTGVIRSMF